MSPTNRVRLTWSVVIGSAVGVASGWLIFAFLIRAPEQTSRLVVLVVGLLLALPLVVLGSVRLIASGRRHTADRESQPLTIFIRLVAAVAVIAGVMLMIASLFRLDSIANEHALHDVSRSGLVALSILLVLLGGLGLGFYALAQT